MRAIGLLSVPLRARLLTSRFLPKSTVFHIHRAFHAAAILQRTETHILSDIGEGVKEVQVIQWFVEEGAAVEEWAPLCEVQSDKASVEITSKYSGIVKKLHFDQDAIVQVGDGMLDIEVESEVEEAEDLSTNEEQRDGPKSEKAQEIESKEPEVAQEQESIREEESQAKESEAQSAASRSSSDQASNESRFLATPAVRGLLKKHSLDIADIKGTGMDGRVLKEDVLRHIDSERTTPETSMSNSPSETRIADLKVETKQSETPQNLTPIQSAMFKSMTRSLSIPHFLFSDTTDVGHLNALRTRLNNTRDPSTTPKFSYMPFVIKAVSLALNRYPLLNARIDTSTDQNKPKLMMRTNHNIGVAMDTPAGLLVPVIKNVNARSITSIAIELQRLTKLGQNNKFSSEDLSEGTMTVSNIGNIGGEVVGPVLVEGQLAILGMGKIKPTPVFAADGVSVTKAEMMNISWSADHRVVDGATMARMAVLVKSYLEHPDTMLVELR